MQRYRIAREAVWRARRLARPAWLGSLRRTTPLSLVYGFDRGTPVDRYYVEHFLKEHRNDIRGRVLEVKDSGYTDRFGTEVTQADVLDIDAQNPKATVVADLAAADNVPSDTFDCFLLVHTLQLIYDFHAAIRHSHRILRPGGVLLAVVGPVRRLSLSPEEKFQWGFLPDSCSRLFGDTFGAEKVSVQSYGNVLSCVAATVGMAHEELSPAELNVNDPSFPLIIGVRAVK